MTAVPGTVPDTVRHYFTGMRTVTCVVTPASMWTLLLHRPAGCVEENLVIAGGQVVQPHRRGAAFLAVDDTLAPGRLAAKVQAAGERNALQLDVLSGLHAGVDRHRNHARVGARRHESPARARRRAAAARSASRRDLRRPRSREPMSGATERRDRRARSATRPADDSTDTSARPTAACASATSVSASDERVTRRSRTACRARRSERRTGWCWALRPARRAPRSALGGDSEQDRVGL